jgi:uncharacterized protein YkwD
MHRASSGLRSHPVLLLLIPLVVLTIPGLLFSGTLLRARGAELPAAPVAKTMAAAVSAGPSAGSGATPSPLPDLGVAKGTLTLKGPSKAPRGSFVVFVVDGRRRVVKTDAAPPYSAALNTRALPNGRYTVTVLWARAGKSSVASTALLTVRNARKKPPPPTPTTPTPTKPSQPTPTATRTTPSGGGSGSAYADQVLTLTNAERAKAGCQPLAVNAKLASVAQGHSADMAANNYFSHDGRDGKSPFDRMKAAGYSFSAAAENIAMGQQTPSSVMSAWMNSAGHKANILNCTYTEIGIGYALGGSPYWTQDFAKPL